MGEEGLFRQLVFYTYVYGILMYIQASEEFHVTDMGLILF